MIFFNMEKARRFLIKHGYVYTLRPRLREGVEAAVYGSWYKYTKIARVVSVRFVKVIKDKSELLEYVGKSGFETVDEWWEAAEGSRFLYYVEVLEW